MKIKNLFLLSILLIINLIASFTLVYADDQNVTALLEKGRNSINTYQFDEAILYYDQVLKIDPNNKLALANKGVALANIHKYHDAMTYFDKVLQTYPDDINALNNKAALLMKLGEYNESMIYFDKVLKIEPGNPVAASNKKALLNREYVETHSQKYIARLSIISQIQIRDSHERLVGYIEPSRIAVPDPDFFDTVLDTTSIGKYVINGNYYDVQKNIMSKNNKKYEQMTITSESIFLGNETVGSKTGYKQGDQWIYFADHDGYQLIKGDHLVLTWKVLRPVK